MILHTDYYYGKWGGLFNVFLKGNKDGRPYPRSGQAGLNVVAPGYYIDSNNDGMIDYETEYNTISNYNFDIEGAGEYADRVEGAPYFYYFNGQDGIGQDWYPLDTENYLIYIEKIENVIIDDNLEKFQTYEKFAKTKMIGDLYNTYDTSYCFPYILYCIYALNSITYVYLK